jgi:hypothetical protein
LHLCAAGLGPDAVSIGLIDQDKDNGNVERTLNLADRLSKIGQSLRHGGVHKLSADSHVFKTEINLINGTGLWCPLEGENPTLEDAFGYQRGMPPELKPLFEALFSKGERETTLTEGYRGVPSIGAAILAGRAFSSDPFWQAIAKEMEDGSGTDGRARLFVFGSLFGGTGASGFPTLARVIRDHSIKLGLKGVGIGGALMLPYFHFQDPKKNDGELRANANRFAAQTENALQYYNRLLGTDPVIYDEVYLVGWNPPIQLTYSDDGGNIQENPPMVPEIFAALAASRFLQADISAPGTFYKIGIENDQDVKWSDLPAVKKFDREAMTEAKARVSERMAQLIRFCFAFRRVYRPCLSRENWKQYRNEEWMRRQLLDADVNLNDAVVVGILDELDRYAEDHLKWSARIAAYGAGGDLQPLYDIQSYARFDREKRGGKAAITLNDELDQKGNALLPGERPRYLDAFQRIGFSGLTKSGAGVSLASVLVYLTYHAPNRDHRKLGQFIGELHEACGEQDKRRIATN